MFRRAMVFGMLPIALFACGTLPSATDTPQPVAPLPVSALPSTPSSPQMVTFTVSASAEAFSDRHPIILRVYDAEQIAIADQTSNCSVSFDVTTGEERISCPPGVTYRPTTPEETTVPRSQLGQGVVFASKTVTVGERYRISLGGMAADNCNSAGAFTEGVATTPAIALMNLDVAQTLIGCPPSE